MFDDQKKAKKFLPLETRTKVQELGQLNLVVAGKGTALKGTSA